VYAIAIIRYRRPFAEIEPTLAAHRAYLGTLKEKGTLLASGPFEPRFGGGVLLRVSDEGHQAALDAVRDNDPYVKAGLAYWEIWPWKPNYGVEGLDRL
jgi:uncharacterized protein YciI